MTFLFNILFNGYKSAFNFICMSWFRGENADMSRGCKSKCEYRQNTDFTNKLLWLGPPWHCRLPSVLILNSSTLCSGFGWAHFMTLVSTELAVLVSSSEINTVNFDVLEVVVAFSFTLQFIQGYFYYSVSNFSGVHFTPEASAPQIRLRAHDFGWQVGQPLVRNCETLWHAVERDWCPQLGTLVTGGVSTYTSN